MTSSQSESGSISAIVPTIGRPESLLRLLESLALQSRRPDEVIVADGSSGTEVQEILERFERGRRGLFIRRISVQPPNAVRQRQMAISESLGEYLLLLDDDVALDARCVEEMLQTMTSMAGVVGVNADFNNETWAGPTRAWRLYLKWCHGFCDGEWRGRVIGPLLRFGYDPSPAHPARMEWLGAGMSLIKRSAYDQVGGFSDFFLHRCTMNEDVDLGLKLSRVGQLLLCPSARMGHFHALSGRASPRIAAEDDLFNRYLVMRWTQGRRTFEAFGMILLYFLIETASNSLGCLSRRESQGFFPRLFGRLRALGRILVSGTFLA